MDEGVARKACLEVLDDGREVELVACTREAPQAHSLEAVMGLYVRKAHLDPFALVTRFANSGVPISARA